MTQIQGRLAFALMVLVFRVRDSIWPPENTLRRIGVSPRHTFLDFGCGPGSFSMAAARLVGPAGKVYALDVNPLTVRRVQKNAEKESLKNITAISADNPSGLPSHSVDVAFLHDVLHLLADTPSVIAGLHRALKREGWLWVGDHHMKEAAIVSAVTAGEFFRPARSSPRCQRMYDFEPTNRE